MKYLIFLLLLLISPCYAGWDDGLIPTSAQVQVDANQVTLDLAKDIIRQYEGVRLNAYRDTKRRSIGYGTKSYKGETITLEEAKRRSIDQITWRLDIVKSDFPDYSPKQHAALTSYLYNCPSVYTLLVSRGITESLRKSCRTSGGVVMRGLIVRRQAEWDLFNQ